MFINLITKNLFFVGAQILGIVGMILLFTIYQQNDRKKLLKRKLMADVTWGLHYMFLFAWSGAIPNFVGIFREIIFMNDDKKWAKSKMWPLIFILISWTLTILTWKSFISVLPICASTLVTISLWSKNTKMTKLLTIPVCSAFIIYDIFVHSYAGIINEALSLISIGIDAYKNFRTNVGVCKK